MTREEARQIIATWLVSSKGAKGQLGYIEGWFQESDVEAFRMAIEALKSERPKGEWIDDCTCSNCNWMNENDDGRILLTTYNYCPNCGAKMKGGAE